MIAEPVFAKLDSGAWNRLAELTDRFEEAWSRGSRPAAIEDFLPRTGDPLRPVVLEELIKTDLEIRWRKGEPLRLEDYAEQFPELGPWSEISPRLVYEEYHVRHRHGDQPALSDYRGRFPGQFPELARLVREQPIPALPQLSTLMSRDERIPAPSGAAYTVLPLGGGYTLVDRIADGGFGQVWRAEAPGGVEVAIKILPGTVSRADAFRERKALELMKGLRHPFLAQVQAFWQFEEQLLIVMELADGSLRDRHKQCAQSGRTGIPPEELLRYTLEAAEALDYLHGRQVLHRDVKPDNVLLVGGHAKLADFGLARVMESRRMVETTGCGTPAYMAPETWRRNACAQSDQYGLAVTYAELRLGRPLFPDRNLADLMLAHAGRVPDLTPLGREEQAVLHQALAKDPAARFPTCGTFVQALARALEADTSADDGAWIADDSDDPGRHGVQRIGLRQRPFSGRRGRLAAVGAALATCAAACAAVWLPIQRPPASPPPDPAGLARPYYDRGLDRLQRGDYWGAVAELDEAIRVDPADALAYNYRGNALFRLDRLEEALRDYDRALAADPGLARVYHNRANLYVEQGDFEPALRDFETALRLDPSLTAVYYSRGRAYLTRRDYRQALANFDEAIRRCPEDGGAYRGRAEALASLGRAEEALADFDRAIERDPADAFAYRGRADVRRQKGDRAGAKADYRRAEELDPQGSPAADGTK